jgi:hypothetical protein
MINSPEQRSCPCRYRFVNLFIEQLFKLCHQKVPRRVKRSATYFRCLSTRPIPLSIHCHNIAGKGSPETRVRRSHILSAFQTKNNRVIRSIVSINEAQGRRRHIEGSRYSLYRRNIFFSFFKSFRPCGLNVTFIERGMDRIRNGKKGFVNATTPRDGARSMQG